jgi:hypothetical protein
MAACVFLPDQLANAQYRAATKAGAAELACEELRSALELHTFELQQLHCH